jgi:hypothetical protein
MANATFDVEHFIALDRQSIRLQLVAGALVFIIALLVAFGLARFIGATGGVDVITKGAGVFIGLVSLFPFNNCYARWERIKTLEAIKLHPDALDAHSTHDLVKKLYAKFLGV